jgi:hypothetical protein
MYQYTFVCVRCRLSLFVVAAVATPAQGDRLLPQPTHGHHQPEKSRASGRAESQAQPAHGERVGSVYFGVRLDHAKQALGRPKHGAGAVLVVRSNALACCILFTGVVGSNPDAPLLHFGAKSAFTLE